MGILLSTFLGCSQVNVVPKNMVDRVEYVRELSFKRAVKRTRKSKSQILEYLRSRVEEEYVGDEIRHEETVLKLLNLIPSDYPYQTCILEFLTHEIGGYYDPRKEEMVFPETQSTSGVERSIVYHELTHALQDQHFGLETFLRRDKENDDKTLARQALIEGEAMWVMTQIAAEDFPLDTRTNQTQEPFSISKKCELPPRVLQGFLFPYTEGLKFVISRFQDGGWETISRHFERELPLSTEQILHPDEWGQKKNAPIGIPSNQISKLSPWLSTNVLGEFGFAQILGGQAARGWGGDRFWLIQKENGKAVFLDLSVWDNQAEAQEFVKEWEKSGKGPFIHERNMVLLAIGMSKADLKKYQGIFNGLNLGNR